MLHIWICNSNRCCYWLVKYPVGLQKSVKMRLILASDAKRIYHLYHLCCNMLSIKCLYEWNNQEDGVQRYVLSRTHLNVFFFLCAEPSVSHVCLCTRIEWLQPPWWERASLPGLTNTRLWAGLSAAGGEHLNTELKKDNGSGTSEAVSRPLFKSVAFFFFVQRWCRATHTRSGFGGT